MVCRNGASRRAAGAKCLILNMAARAFRGFRIFALRALRGHRLDRRNPPGDTDFPAAARSQCPSGGISIRRRRSLTSPESVVESRASFGKMPLAS